MPEPSEMEAAATQRMWQAEDERDAALKQVAALQERLEEARIDALEWKLAAGAREQDMDKDVLTVVRERDAARAERDSLAEALRRIDRWANSDYGDHLENRMSLIREAARSALRDGDPEAGSESPNQQSVEGQLTPEEARAVLELADAYLILPARDPWTALLAKLRRLSQSVEGQ